MEVRVQVYNILSSGAVSILLLGLSLTNSAIERGRIDMHNQGTQYTCIRHVSWFREVDEWTRDRLPYRTPVHYAPLETNLQILVTIDLALWLASACHDLDSISIWEVGPVPFAAWQFPQPHSATSATSH